MFAIESFAFSNALLERFHFVVKPLRLTYQFDIDLSHFKQPSYKSKFSFIFYEHHEPSVTFPAVHLIDCKTQHKDQFLKQLEPPKLNIVWQFQLFTLTKLKSTMYNNVQAVEYHLEAFLQFSS